MTQHVFVPGAPSQEQPSLAPGQSVIVPGASFDPSTQPLTTWQQAPYVGPPWPGAASIGPSGLRESSNRVGPPGAGAALNGHVSVLYDNSVAANNNALIYQTIVGPADIDITDAINPGPVGGPQSYTLKGMMRIESASPPVNVATPYAAQSMFNGNARVGNWFDDTFIGMWHFNGAFPIVRAPHPGLHIIFKFAFRWDSVALTMRIDINNLLAPTIGALPAVTVLNGVSCLNAIDGFTTALGSHSMWDQTSSKTYESDADINGYFTSYLPTRYGVP